MPYLICDVVQGDRVRADRLAPGQLMQVAAGQPTLAA